MIGALIFIACGIGFGLLLIVVVKDIFEND